MQATFTEVYPSHTPPSHTQTLRYIWKLDRSIVFGKLQKYGLCQVVMARVDRFFFFYG